MNERVAVITTSVYEGLELFEEVTLPSISSQSFRDLVWYFFDGHKEANSEKFAALTRDLPFEVHHLPLLHAEHYPHAFLWEPYNSALLVARESLVFRWGLYRRYHPRAIEIAQSITRRGFVTDFSQSQMGQEAGLSDSKLVDEPGRQESKFVPACGMFCIHRDDMIQILNGNDEVGLHWLHFEDVEMGARASRSGLQMVRVEGWLDRFWHQKPYAPKIERQPVPADWSQWKPAWFKNREMGTFKTIEAAEAETGLVRAEACAEMMRRNGCRRVECSGYQGLWFCETDGSLSHADPWGDGYRDWVVSAEHVRSIAGVGGMKFGRNLAKIDRVLCGVADVSKRVGIVDAAWLDDEVYRE